jgi:uncharacterized protein YjcR
MGLRPPTSTSFRAGHVPGNAVLTPQNAVDIRKLHGGGWSMKQLAAIYGVSFTHIHAIITRKKWKNAEQQI